MMATVILIEKRLRFLGAINGHPTEGRVEFCIVIGGNEHGLERLLLELQILSGLILNSASMGGQGGFDILRLFARSTAMGMKCNKSLEFG